MPNIFEAIEQALQPSNPWKPAKVLAAEIKFKVPKDILAERDRISKIYRDATERMNYLGTALVQQVEDERAQARQAVESGTHDTWPIKTKEELRTANRNEIKTIKMGLRDILDEFAQKCRPVVEDFVRLAEPHVEAVAAAERSECERFGLPYVEGSLVSGLREAVRLTKSAIPTPGALNSPASFLPWLDPTRPENPFA